MVVQLIAKDKQEKLQYEGKCKLVLDTISKLLLVEPFNEEFKMISAMFKWKFVAQKNILFVFAEHDFQDFALIFDNSNKCKKIYEILVKKEATPGDKDIIHERFLPELFNEISGNTESSSKLKEILFKWIEFQDGKEKEEYIQLLKNHKIFDLIFPCIKASETSNPRKRKAKECFYKKNKSDKNNEFDAKRPNGNLKKIIELPNFEILKYIQNGHSKTKLSISPNAEIPNTAPLTEDRERDINLLHREYFLLMEKFKVNQNMAAHYLESNGGCVDSAFKEYFLAARNTEEVGAIEEAAAVKEAAADKEEKESFKTGAKVTESDDEYQTAFKIGNNSKSKYHINQHTELWKLDGTIFWKCIHCSLDKLKVPFFVCSPDTFYKMYDHLHQNHRDIIDSETSTNRKAKCRNQKIKL